MYKRITLCLFMLIGLTVNAQTINVRGKVSNHAGTGVSNAIVTLVRQGLKDTTGTDGAYSITGSTAVESPSLPPEFEQISMNRDRGILELFLTHQSTVKVEIFNVKGDLLQKEFLQNALAGVYRLNIAKNCHTANLLVIHASIDSREMSFCYLPLQNGKYAVNSIENSAQVNGKLAKIAAVNDTLKITAAGYMSNVAAIASYDTVVNITLDTSGAAGHTPGCGTTPKLVKSTPPTKTSKPSGSTIAYNKVTVNGKSRQYILWWPDNYDNTHPYRLIICYHWMSGSASQVFDCTTEGINCYTTQVPFYNMLTISNNTAIFVAPDGLNAGWGNSNGEDLTFTDSIIAQVKNNLCIDTTRIFACGFSYGGSMSYAIACDRAPVFRGVGVFSGAQMSGCTDGKKPIAYYASHGLDDKTLNISGGRSLRDHFVTVNGCTAQTPPEPAEGSGTHICTTYSGCSAGHPVRWCAFAGSNGHDPSPRDPGQSVTWNGQETWNFFTQF